MTILDRVKALDARTDVSERQREALRAEICRDAAALIWGIRVPQATPRTITTDKARKSRKA